MIRKRQGKRTESDGVIIYDDEMTDARAGLY